MISHRDMLWFHDNYGEMIMRMMMMINWVLVMMISHRETLIIRCSLVEKPFLTSIYKVGLDIFRCVIYSTLLIFISLHSLAVELCVETWFFLLQVKTVKYRRTKKKMSKCVQCGRVKWCHINLVFICICNCIKWHCNPQFLHHNAVFIMFLPTKHLFKGNSLFSQGIGNDWSRIGM